VSDPAADSLRVQVQRDVEADELVRGWEVSKGQFVMIEDADLEALSTADDSRTIAQMVKALALVVSAGADARLVNEAVLALEAVKAPLIGVIAHTPDRPARNSIRRSRARLGWPWSGRTAMTRSKG